MSPLPISRSAPGWSRITRLSASDDTEKAMRDGMLALITPVITSTDGRWVASTRWIPTARAIWAIRQTDSSTSRAATIMRSLSSSTTIRMNGSRGRRGSVDVVVLVDLGVGALHAQPVGLLVLGRGHRSRTPRLYPVMSRWPTSASRS